MIKLHLPQAKTHVLIAAVALVLLLLGVATAAHSHDEVDLPEPPLPEIKRIFPVADLHTAFQWAGEEPSERVLNSYRNQIDSQRTGVEGYLNSWYVLELSESQFEQIRGVLASIQEPLDRWNLIEQCKGTEDRFRLRIETQIPEEVNREGQVRIGPLDTGSTSGLIYHYSLATRFMVMRARFPQDADLRDSGWTLRAWFRLIDEKNCEAEHVYHTEVDGVSRPNIPHVPPQIHYWPNNVISPVTDWIPIADLLDGNVAATSPAPEVPEAPEAPETPETLAAPEQARAELDRREIPYVDWAFLLYAQTGDLEVVKLFITAGFSIETKNPADDFTALHTAATYGHLEVVKYLVGQGATVDATGKNGETPLMWAAVNGHLEVVKYLVGQGASLLAETTRGDRAKDLAEQGGFTAVATYLQGLGADNSDELAQLRATVAALQSEIDALQAAAGGTTTITLVDTVEVARVDTLHWCPPSDEDRQDLFDAFTGVNSDTSGTVGAGKAASVKPSSWGAIKALMQDE